MRYFIYSLVAYVFLICVQPCKKQFCLGSEVKGSGSRVKSEYFQNSRQEFPRMENVNGIEAMQQEYCAFDNEVTYTTFQSCLSSSRTHGVKIFTEKRRVTAKLFQGLVENLQDGMYKGNMKNITVRLPRMRWLGESNSSDSSALLAIKSALQDPGNFLATWNLSTNPDICLGWHGISCSSSGEVTVLNLTAVNTSQTLSGPLSSSIGQLASLQMLSLANHDLSGPLPSELGLLPVLQIVNLTSNAFIAPLPEFQNSSLLALDLSNNNFNDTFTNILGQLANVNSSLQHLDLSENQISGEITEEILSFTSLSFFDIFQNNFTGAIPAAIGALDNLQSLDLSFNFFVGEIPSSLGLLSNLSTLVLDHNNFTGSIPIALKNCSSLSLISLNNNTLSGTVPDEILESLSQTLTYFSVQANLLKGPISSSFINCSLLETLDLSLNNFTGSIPTLCHSNQSQLTNLVLDLNSLSGNLPLDLALCHNLQLLAVSSNNFSGSIPESYASELPLVEFAAANNNLDGPFPTNISGWIQGGLKNVYLDNNDIGGNLPEDIGLISTLEQLLIASNSLTGPLPPSIINCTKLLNLALYNNKLTGGIPPGFGNIRNLSYLFLQNNRLEGEFPPEIGELTQLRNLNITKNLLNGSIPESLGNLSILRLLNLAFNNFTGTVPSSLGRLGFLFSLRLNDNSLSGTLPPELANLSSIETILINNNKFTGEFPWGVVGVTETLSRLDFANNSFTGALPSGQWERHADSLIRMRLQGNKFSGEIPYDFSSLVNLEILELFDNQFTGSIPAGFANLTKLILFNVSNNKLSGEIPGGALLNFNASCFQGNSGLCGIQIAANCGGKGSDVSDPGPLAGLIIGCVVLLALLGFVALYFILYKKKEVEEEKLFSFKDVGVNLTIDVIRAATENFDPDRQIGEGGQGSVFRATLENGTEIAVKRCRKAANVHKAISSEVQTLGQVRHRNLATLVACIVAEEEILILYEYVAGGDLSNLLVTKGKKPKGKKQFLPSWKESFELILGSAQGLEYLHHSCPVTIIHRDIKPANILLGEKNTPLIGDFGLSRFINNTKPHVSTIAAGTVGYLAPECSETGKVTTASDVFSFGVVMLGIVTGKGPNSSVAQEMEYSTWVEESGLEAAMNSRSGELSAVEKEQMEKVIQIGLSCCSKNPTERPTMLGVVKTLNTLECGIDLPQPQDDVRMDVV